MHDCTFNNSLIIMIICKTELQGRLQQKCRIDSDLVSAVTKIIFKFWRSDVIVIAMIKGEIIAMENRLHGCVFRIVIGGIDNQTKDHWKNTMWVPVLKHSCKNSVYFELRVNVIQKLGSVCIHGLRMVSKRQICVGLHCTVVGDRTKTRMNDEYSFAMFLVTFLRVKIKLWVRLDLDTL